MTRQHQPIVSGAGEGDAYWTGFPDIIRVSGEDTGGTFSVIEMRVPPGYAGPPHIHHNEHETFYTVKGELEYTIGDETIVGEAGKIVHGPMGIPHAFSNESDSEAIAHTWVHPAGFEDFMARAAPPITDPSDPPELEMERVLELAPEYGVEFLVDEGDGPVKGD